MAGAGYKLFNTGDVLTAAQVNTYLQEQSVMVFADAAARTTALSGVLAEGMITYLKSTDAVEVYNGSAWVGVAGASSPLTTKGDLYTYSTTNARLGVGTNGQVLTADSTQSTGLKWATPSGGTKSWTLLNAGGTALTGASTITVSGISGKEDLLVLIVDSSSASAGSFIGVRPNGISTNYAAGYAAINPAGTYSAGIALNTASTAFTSIQIGAMSNAAASEVSGYAWISGCSGTGNKNFTSSGSGTASTSNQHYAYMGGGIVTASAAITSIDVISSVGNFDKGTVYVYGA